MAPPSRTFLPPHPTPTEHWVELPVSYSKFPLVTYLTYGYLFYLWRCICFSATLSFIPSFPSPAVPTSLFSISESLFLCCK